MKTKRKYFYLDDFEHRLLVGCLMTAWNENIHEGKPTDYVNEVVFKKEENNSRTCVNTAVIYCTFQALEAMDSSATLKTDATVTKKHKNA